MTTHTVEEYLADEEIRFALIGSVRAAREWRELHKVPFRRTIGVHTYGAMRGFTLTRMVLVWLSDAYAKSERLLQDIEICKLGSTPIAEIREIPTVQPKTAIQERAEQLADACGCRRAAVHRSVARAQLEREADEKVVQSLIGPAS